MRSIGIHLKVCERNHDWSLSGYSRILDSLDEKRSTACLFLVIYVAAISLVQFCIIIRLDDKRKGEQASQSRRIAPLSVIYKLYLLFIIIFIINTFGNDRDAGSADSSGSRERERESEKNRVLSSRSISGWLSADTGRKDEERGAKLPWNYLPVNRGLVSRADILSMRGRYTRAAAFQHVTHARAMSTFPLRN